MSKNKQLVRLTSLIAAFTLVASACGGSSSDDAADNSAEESAASTGDATSGAEESAADESEGSEAGEESDGAMEDVTGSIKVGMITTLSGGAAYLGQDIQDGFELAFQLDDRIELDLVVEDDGRDPAVGQELAEKMIDRDEVELLTGIVFSNVAGAVVPDVVGQDLIYISPNAAPSPFAGESCNANYFVGSWQNDNAAEAMGQSLKDQGYENVVALAPNYQAGHDFVNGFKRTFGEPVAEIFTELGATDYAQAIAEIRAAEPDAVYFFYPGGMGIAFVQQYVDSGLDIPVFGPTFSFDETLVDAIGEASLGIQNSGFWAPDLDVPGNAEFVAAFKETYGRTPTTYAVQSFDTANLIISAVVKNGGSAADIEGMRAALKEADFQSVRGNFSFNSNNHPIQDWYMLEVVEDPDGGYTNTIIGEIFKDHSDAYAELCDLS